MTSAQGTEAIGRGLAYRGDGREQAGSPDGRSEPVSPAAVVSLTVLAMALVLAALVAWQLLVDPRAFVDRLVAGGGGWLVVVRSLVGL